ncbi:MAG: phosphate acyltransferase [Anaerolineaceae bacterium]|nr:phosphate acyltransferase [Anaerolineaceae bacterium]
MRIALDVMGTDQCPTPDIAGAILAAKTYGYKIYMVGDQQKIEQELKQHTIAGLPLEVVPAADTILPTDKPSAVGKGKPQSSMHIGMNLVKDGEADAFVTMGNTGAAHAIATLFTLKRIEGVKRPALSGIFPVAGNYIVMLDLGANADSKPDWLLQFGLMGSIYASNALNLASPRIGLLSNGEEEGKGNQLIRDADQLYRQSTLNYVGNVEPKEVMHGKAEVIVADGFLGNIFVKTFESSVTLLVQTIREEIKADLPSMLGGLMLKPAFGRVRKRTDTFEVGGAPLLGVNGVVIIGHGRSNAVAVKNAIHQAAIAVEGRVIDTIRQGLREI